MKMPLNSIFLLLLVLCLTSCAYPEYKDPFFPHPDVNGKAKIYLYRSKTTIHAANPDVPRFYVGEKEVGRLMIGGYFVEWVDPGKVKFTYKKPLFGIFFPWHYKGIEFEAKPNETYYLTFIVEPLMGGGTMYLVDPRRGETEIKQTQLLVNE